MSGHIKNKDQKSKTKGLRGKLLVLAAAVVILWLLSWVAAKALVVEAPLAHADAIVVMAGSAVFKERTQHAAELFRAGRGPKIIVTNDNQQGGWAADEQRNIPYQELAARYLRREGVPSDAIEIVPEPANGTYEEVKLLRRTAEEKGYHSLLIVTSAYHTRRARWTLERTFASSGIAVGLDAVPPGRQAPPPATWWLHLSGWRLVPGEYVKLVYYWLFYRN